MNYRIWGLWILLSAVSLNAAEPLRVESATSAPEWDAHFQRTSGWIGADGNYSVRVAPDRVLWFFSDTLLGRVESGRRVDSRMINNSIGVQTDTLTGPQLEFFHGSAAPTEGQAPQPAAFLRPDDPAHWYWLLGVTFVEGRVHLFLWEFSKSSDPGVFGFQNVGVAHAVIDNPLDAPPDWKVTRQPLGMTEITPQRRVLFGSAVMTHEDYVYIYGTRETPKEKLSPRQLLVARAPVSQLSDHSAWEFRTTDGWSQDFRAATPQLTGLAAEHSIHFRKSAKQFVLVTHGDLLSPRIVGRVADQPWGPWSEAVELWTCPEPAQKKGYFAYAGKAHSELSPDDELLVTYAVNSFQFSDLFNDATLYWPRFIKVKLAPLAPK